MRVRRLLNRRFRVWLIAKPENFCRSNRSIMVPRTKLLFCLIALLSSCSSYDKPGGTTFSRALRVPETVRRTSGSAESSPTQNAVMSGVTASQFAKRIVGGELIRAENGTLVVRATAAKDNLQPVGLTTDAIITSSVLNKMGSQPRLKAGGFEVSSTNGVVSIHGRNDSIDDAVAAINLALSVPDVRQVVYAIPARV